MKPLLLLTIFTALSFNSYADNKDDIQGNNIADNFEGFADQFHNTCLSDTKNELKASDKVRFCEQMMTSFLLPREYSPLEFIYIVSRLSTEENDTKLLIELLNLGQP